jgi:uncharacterized protein YndB with AHSA1/START domain
VTAQISNDVIVATEYIEAPPEVVFPYFTDPALIVKWIGDRAELNPQPGGVFSLGMGQVTACGAFITVEPPYRVAFSWGIPGSDTLPPGGSAVEVVLTPDGHGTMVVLSHRGLRAADIGTHRAGWEHQLGLLRVAAGLGGPGYSGLVPPSERAEGGGPPGHSLRAPGALGRDEPLVARNCLRRQPPTGRVRKM